MKNKKVILVGILVIMLLFPTGYGTEKRYERKEERAENVVVEKDGS